MLLPLLRTARPQQWLKNTVCFFGVIFSGKLVDPGAVVSALVAFMTFSLASASVYVVNDILDAESDRQNPKKANRPIASGELSQRAAWVGYAMFFVCTGVGAWYLGPICAVILGIYLLMNLIYSVSLKHALLLDVICIAMGFVFRVLVGVYAVGALPTSWIILCMFFLALFLGFGKRRGELSNLGEGASAHRSVLQDYTVGFLDSLVNLSAGMAIVSYSLFATTPTKNPSLVITVPLVVYGILRYKLLVVVQRGVESPERLLIHDRQLVVTSCLWMLLCIAILYGDIRIFA